MIEFKDNFLSAADSWICDGYALEIRYIARQSSSSLEIMCASIRMNPLKATTDDSFDISTEDICAGKIHLHTNDKKDLLRILNEATDGFISLPPSNLVIRLPASNHSTLNFYSDTLTSDQWFHNLNLHVDSGKSLIATPNGFSAKIDQQLRIASTPFDGFSDLASSLDFGASVLNSTPAIKLLVGTPIDLRVDESRLANNELKLICHAHPNFNINNFYMTVRSTPGISQFDRGHVTKEFQWDEAQSDRKIGAALIRLNNVEGALTMLTVGTSTARRQWFVDPMKTANKRLVAVSGFDLELRKIKSTLFENKNGDEFEKSVAALLFLLGFSPMQQIEKEAPDLIVLTPKGQIAIVECTTQINDFTTKFTKLLNRRTKLVESLKKANHYADVLGVLVTRQLRREVIRESTQRELHSQKIHLLTGEDLEENLARVGFPNDPDKIIDDINDRLRSNANAISSIDGGSF